MLTVIKFTNFFTFKEIIYWKKKQPTFLIFTGNNFKIKKKNILKGISFKNSLFTGNLVLKFTFYGDFWTFVFYKELCFFFSKIQRIFQKYFILYFYNSLLQEISSKFTWEENRYLFQNSLFKKKFEENFKFILEGWKNLRYKRKFPIHRKF